jgi:hypothetical protein
MKLISLHRLAVRAIPRSLMVSAALLVAPTWVHAQTSPGTGTHRLTRAEVQHELEELEAAGYNPSQGDDGAYPADIQEAEIKVAAMHAAQTNASMDKQSAGQATPMH